MNTITALSDEETRKIVMEYMFHGGKFYNLLPAKKWNYIYVNLCDGFGKIDRHWAVQQYWDWSHVRDSSPEAFRKIYLYLKGRKLI